MPRERYALDKRPAVLQAIVDGVPRSKAGAAGGVATSTYYLWLKEDPEFLEQVEQAEAKRLQIVLDWARKTATGKQVGNARMIEILLRPLAPEFRDKEGATNVSVAVQTDVNVTVQASEIEEIQRLRRAAMHGAN